MAETVYEMMMKLSLDHLTAMAGLNMIGARLVNLAKEASSARLAIVGLAGIGFGGATVFGLVKALEVAKEFSKEMTALRTLGTMGDLIESGAMDKKAFSVAKITGQKVEDVLKIAGFASSILDPENTMKALEGLSKFSMIQGDKVSEQGKAIQNVIRSGMITGRITDSVTGDIDMDKLHKFLDEFQRLKAGTHGAFNEDVLYGMAKQGGGYLRGLTTEGMEHMAIIAQSLGGPRTGTAFLSIYEQLARGQMTKKTAEGMEAAGLLKPGEWSMDKNVVKLDPEVSKALTAKFGGDPLALAKEIRENLIKQGITDPQEQMRATANAFGRQTSRRFMAEEVADYQQMIGEGKRLGQGYGTDQTFDTKLAHDMEFNLTRLQNAWHNLMVAFADPQSDAFIIMLQKLQGVVIGFSDSLKGADPESLMNISKGLAGLGIALVAGGMVAVIAAIGPMGWLVGAFVALAAINWEKTKGLVNFVNTISGVMRTIDQWSEMKGTWRPDAWLADKLLGKGGPNVPAPVPVVPPTDPNPNLLWGREPAVPQSWIDFFKHPSSFSPGKDQKQVLQPVTLTINLDGHQMGQAMSEILEDLYTHPTGPPEANGWAHFRSQGRHDSA